jgi:hypothetical protein
MDGVVLKHGLAVAAVAKVGHRQKKKARIIRVMHIVAGKAKAFGNRRVLDRMRELCLVVAAEAEISACREQKFSRLCLIFVRLGMAGHAAAGLDYRMEGLALKFGFVADGAVRELFGICTEGEENGYRYANT